MSEPRQCAIVGVVGGASSGKSTLFNNLIAVLEGRGVRQASRVMMRSHTTKGPIAGAPAQALDVLRDWAAHYRWGGFTRAPSEEQLAPDAPAVGREEALTLLACASSPAFDQAALVDTPDFTSLEARESGDIARRMLPWLDRVIVVIDEDRWFDEQVFGWLGARLDQLVPRQERVVVFNRTQRGAAPAERLSEQERAELHSRAAKIASSPIFIDYQPGRGLVNLSVGGKGPVHELAAWAARSVHPESAGRRRELLLAEVQIKAGQVLEENARRAALVARLERSLDAERRACAQSDRQIAYDVLLTTEQRRQLDPVWQALVRPVSWLGSRVRSAGRMGRPGAPTDSEMDDEASIAERGRRFFVRQTALTMDRLVGCAVLSEVWSAGGESAEIRGRDKLIERAERRGAELAGECQQRYEEFIRRFEDGAREVKLGAASSSGAIIGAIVGAILSLPAGGVTAPAGAALGAAIGASALAASGRSVYRLAKLLIGTTETRRLWESVRTLRAGLERLQEEASGLVVQAARSKTIEDDDLRGALRVLGTPRMGQGSPEDARA